MACFIRVNYQKRAKDTDGKVKRSFNPLKSGGLFKYVSPFSGLLALKG